MAGSHRFLQVRAGDQSVVFEQVIPLHAAPNLLRRNMLQIGQVFNIAVGGNRGKALVVSLRLTEHTRAHPIMRPDTGIDSRDAKSRPRAVHLDRCSVVSRFFKKTAILVV